jgi:D-glycero-beta-D-manno-heptose 1-phosphate adenylyltransferase
VRDSDFAQHLHGDPLSSAILTREQAILRFAPAKDNHKCSPRPLGSRLVFTNGCFDLLHPGHIRTLEEARKLGDFLIVGINSDQSVCDLKGLGRPVVPETERAEMLSALEAVDAVVIFDEPTPHEIIAALLPDVLVKGGDWASDQIIGREEVEAAGGEVVSIPVTPGYSTTAILQKIRANSSAENTTSARAES